MLDLALLKSVEGLERVRASLAARFVEQPEELLERVKELHDAHRSLRFKLDRKNEEYKKKNREVGQRKKRKEDAEDLIKEAQAIDVVITKLKEEEVQAHNALLELWSTLGNLVDAQVFISNDEEQNPVLSVWDPEEPLPASELPPDALLHHHQLLEKIDGYESRRGARISGHRGYYLKGFGWMLNQALVNAAMQFLVARDFTPLQPPFFMNKDVMAKTAQLSSFDDELYLVTGEGEKYLIATSEQPISALHMGEWLRELPLRYAGVSTNFRREAGSHGKDAWGIFRVHQFEKVEQFCITAPAAPEGVEPEAAPSEVMLEEMLRNAEQFLEALGIRYRRVQIVSGALNNAAAKKCDIEGWFPTLGMWRELMSVSNCTDYQSRRLEVRYETPGTKNRKGKAAAPQRQKLYVQMLNGTLCATERTLCCILENYQTKEGIRVPTLLQPWLSMFLRGQRRGEDLKCFIPFGEFASHLQSAAADAAESAGGSLPRTAPPSS